MSITTKIGAITFAHTPDYSGEVEIRRGDAVLVVPFESLQKIVAEKVRAQLIAGIESLKPNEVLALVASKK